MVKKKILLCALQWSGVEVTPSSQKIPEHNLEQEISPSVPADGHTKG